MIDPIPGTDIDALLDELMSGIRTILGEKLVGLYLYGSLVMGDFAPGISDVDLLAATAEAVGGDDFARLQQMHADFAARHKEWDDRIEVAYASTAALQTFKTQPSLIAVISPGEPFHIKEAGQDWLVNWHIVRERGLALYGPAPQSVIAPTTREEFVQTVEDHARAWAEWVKECPPRLAAQAYVILTLCRALYTHTHGEQASKTQAAAWAARAFPEWSGLIERAVQWRKATREAWSNDASDAGAAALPETTAFVHFAIASL